MMAISLLLLTTAASSQAEETITIHERFNRLICAGLCLDFDLVVRSGGSVEYRRRMVFSETWDPPRRYQITPAEYRDFASRLRPIRPKGDSIPQKKCGGDMVRPHIFLWDIAWSGGSPSRLRACGDTPRVQESIGSAMKSLRIQSATGWRLSAKEAAKLDDRFW